jgi:ABC-type sugar transport system ATPase subunit
LILDEPESGLDAQACDSLRSILLERRDRGLSAVLASHRLEWCRTFWDEHLILKSGMLQREARTIATAGTSDGATQDALRAGD